MANYGFPELPSDKVLLGCLVLFVLGIWKALELLWLVCVKVYAFILFCL